MGRTGAMGLAAAALLASGCATDTVSSDVRFGTAAVTYHDPGARFGEFTTYAIWSQIRVARDVNGAVTYSFEPAPEILAAIEANMASRGYTLIARVDPANPPPVPPTADLLITPLAMLVNDTTFYPCDYWILWGYPAFACHYPWDLATYRSGTLLLPMANLSADPPDGQTVPFVWQGVALSVLTPEASENVSIAVGAVNQLFAQSPYLHTP